MTPFIAMLTDFGTKDPFVGLMKTALWERCPEARIVDLTHEVGAQAVSEGAFWLERSLPWLPEAAIVLAVVDPGVGSSRRGIVAEAGTRVFVAPDNGLVTRIVQREGARVHAIDAAKLGLPAPSATFHGRDIFAPIAGELAAGRVRCEDVGAKVAVSDLSPPALAEPRAFADGVEGEVVTVDHFGNLITNIDAALVAAGREATVTLGAIGVPLRRTYSDAPEHAFVAVVNAFGVVEVAQRDGNAAAALGAGPGVKVAVRLRT